MRKATLYPKFRVSTHERNEKETVNEKTLAFISKVNQMNFDASGFESDNPNKYLTYHNSLI